MKIRTGRIVTIIDLFHYDDPVHVRQVLHLMRNENTRFVFEVTYVAKKSFDNAHAVFYILIFYV